MSNTKRIFVSALLSLMLFASSALAHPPKDVSLGWDASGVLTVKAEHKVEDPGKHYISKVIVFVNDKIAAQKEYSSQQSADGFSDTFSLGAQQPGTKISAEVFCVIMGSKSASIVTP